MASISQDDVAAAEAPTAVVTEAAPVGEKPQELYKVIVIGDYACGKTSLIKQYTEGFFTPNYKLTIGVDFAVKAVQYEDRIVNLQLWDVAGHERFGSMTRIYYRFAIAACIVFDLQRPATFEAVLKWREDVNNKVVLANDEPIPCLLLANKCDLPGVEVDDAALDKFCEEHNFVGWFKTSAKTGEGINEAMNCLIEKITEVAAANQLQPGPEDQNGSQVNLGGPPGSGSANGPGARKKGCCE